MVLLLITRVIQSFNFQVLENLNSPKFAVCVIDLCVFRSDSVWEMKSQSVHGKLFSKCLSSVMCMIKSVGEVIILKMSRILVVHSISSTRYFFSSGNGAL